MAFEILKYKQSVLLEAEKAGTKPRTGWQVLIFIGVFFVLNLAMGFIIGIPAGIVAASKGLDISETLSGIYWWTNVALIFIIAGTIMYVKLIERRSLYSMGFTRKGAFGQYMKGFLLGAVMVGAAMGICIVTGTMSYQGAFLNGAYLLLGLWLVGFLVQGMSEEVLCRGYFMVSVANRSPIIIAVILNSVIFAALHLMNNNITALSVINLVLYGGFASLYFLKTDNIWGIGAQHAAWNFFQGNVFGIEVSGTEIPVTAFRFAPSGEGTLINGGAFGLEGGLAVTLVFGIGIIVLLLMKVKPQYKSAPVEAQIEDIPVRPGISHTGKWHPEGSGTGFNQQQAREHLRQEQTRYERGEMSDSERDEYERRFMPPGGG